MNILIPDSWLREHLITKATPKQLKDCLSLCGPSVERINQVDGETVYDIEVTGNRPDSMSITGVAREAAVILPRFGIKAEFVGDPYTQAKTLDLVDKNKLNVIIDPKLCPRFTAIVLENIKIGPSPKWLQKRLELSGVRSINNVIDVTNYLMRLYGQPVHAFDYDEITADTKGIPTMILRESKKGEKLITLDGKTHSLPGGDIVIEDGSGKLIDLCGIMGGENSSIRETTSKILLFVQTYDPMHIRKTSMALAHRTEAAVLFEKGIDTELVLPTLNKGVELLKELADAKVASKLYDLYPNHYKQIEVEVTKEKVEIYLGTKLTDIEIKKILEALGFKTTLTKELIKVSVPSFRRDIEIDVDIIEELARIYGYHNITAHLPEGEVPKITIEPILTWEEKIKERLRDWGYTETFNYSMISEELMNIFDLDKSQTYKISNPLSSDWVYMRPSLLPSMLMTVKQNLENKEELKLFELSMTYNYRNNDIPKEQSTLIVAWKGIKFFEAKGLAETLFEIFGVSFPRRRESIPTQPWIPDQVGDDKKIENLFNQTHLNLGDYGVVGEVNSELLKKVGIKEPVTILELDFTKLVENARPGNKYIPIPKYPPVIEDLSFVLPPQTPVGPLIAALKTADQLVANINLVDTYENTKTLRIMYRNADKNLSAIDIKPIREKLIKLAQEEFSATFKTN